MRKNLAVFLFAAAVSGCGHLDYVKTSAPLGKVVVYRNGVAFYERQAHVTDGHLKVVVPRDRVDDFLKSLTVMDKAGNPIPVAFPRHQTESGANIVMVLDLGTTGPTDVTLTYVSESPAWKPSYRIDVKADGKVTMEGWAIIDNTSGEDWCNVVIGVGSSSALSFHYDLWSVRSVERPTLATEQRFAVAPPTAVSPYGGRPAEQAQAPVYTELGDEELRRPPGAPADEVAIAQPPPSSPQGAPVTKDYRKKVATTGAAAGTAGDDLGVSVSGSSGVENDYEVDGAGKKEPVQKPRVADGDRKLAAVAQQARKTGATVIIQANADANIGGADRRALDKGNVVRNQLIDEGLAPAQIQIVTNVQPGSGDSVRLVAQAPTTPAAAGAGNPAATDDAPPVGESYFRSRQPMNVPQGTSVMVSVVHEATQGEEVYLYDAESERGNERFAFRSVRITNPTDSTLETGPVTVYGEGRFIGEGLTEPIPPHATVVIPYALDRQIVVERTDSGEDKLSRLMTLDRGVLTAEVQHIKRKKLTVTSRLTVATKVYVRHTVDKGWALFDSPKVFERIGDAHLFEIEVPAGETRTIEIAEATPLIRTLDMTSEVCLDMLRVYVEGPAAEGPLREPLQRLLAIHKELVGYREQMITLREQLDEYRERLEELRKQLLSLKKVKNAGDLIAHLKAKTIEISDRVQKATIAMVDLQEKAMLARVRFGDALSDLHLEDVTASASK